LKAWQGQGGYGAVYRAERVGFRRSEPVALKVSLLRWGWRMEREVELLSRLNHPSILRLVDRGGPWPPTGKEYPYFVMEWVPGVGLYAWAEQHAPTGKRKLVERLARLRFTAIGGGGYRTRRSELLARALQLGRVPHVAPSKRSTVGAPDPRVQGERRSWWVSRRQRAYGGLVTWWPGVAPTAATCPRQTSERTVAALSRYCWR
jgi:hypothetical protein